MGSNSSKKQTEDVSTTHQDDLQYMNELSSYKAACMSDCDLQSLDAALHARTSSLINSLADGVEVRSLSLDSLKDVTGCLLEMNQEVVRVILECKKDIWKNQELFDLVEEYFESSLQTLDFCAALGRCLKRCRDIQLPILVALREFDEGDYAKTVEEIKNFKAAAAAADDADDDDQPFCEEFIHQFQSVHKQQILMLQKLQSRKKKLDKKLKCIRAWRKVSCTIFVASFAAILICSVVTAAIAVPPVAAALAAASAIPLGSMGKWIDSLLKNLEAALKGQKDAANAMHVGTYVAIKDLDNIRSLVDRLEISMQSLLQNAEILAINEQGGVIKIKMAIIEINNNLQLLVKNVDDLTLQADACARDIRRARTVVLQRIINPPNYNSS